MCSILEWNSLRCGNFGTPPHLLALTRLMDLCFLNLQIEPYMNFKCASNKPSNPPAVLPFSVGVIELNPKVIRPNDFPASRKVCSEICITIYRLRGTPFLLDSFLFMCVLSCSFFALIGDGVGEREPSIGTINLTQKSYQGVIRLPAEQLTKRAKKGEKRSTETKRQMVNGCLHKSSLILILL